MYAISGYNFHELEYLIMCLEKYFFSFEKEV